MFLGRKWPRRFYQTPLHVFSLALSPSFFPRFLSCSPTFRVPPLKCFKLSNAYLHIGKNTTWSKWRAIFSRKVTFYKGMLPIEKEYSCCSGNAILSEWKCLFVKPALVYWNCFLKWKTCLIVFCGKVIYSVFTAFFRFGEKTESWDSFHAEDALTGTLVSAGFVSDQILQIEDLRKNSSIQDWRLKAWGKLLEPRNLQSRTLDWRSFSQAFNLQSSVLDWGTVCKRLQTPLNKIFPKHIYKFMYIYICHVSIWHILNIPILTSKFTSQYIYIYNYTYIYI